jgi:acetyl/propionyl-CoA carboxylase alpha subunit/acetyl-CoA carboxylase carboxyltransferase component
MNVLLVANRGEIAVRILHSAAELGLRTVTVFSEDDDGALHRHRADLALPLRGSGPAAYLDIDQILSLARDHGCDAIHPGYGFLSESVGFAQQCAEAGITFVGPSAATLATLGEKTRARALAQACGVPVLRGSAGPATLAQAETFLAALGSGAAMVIKAVAGGGGRGLRIVRRVEDVTDAYARCESEAKQAFGNGALYVEELMSPARHIEVQVIGDGTGTVTHLGERECSIQRRHQKLVEIAPCPSLSPAVRARLIADALRLAEAADYRNVGTFEFLVQTDANHDDAAYAFIEANPRLQVEHTVTEEIFGVDLVRIQLQLAAGRLLNDLDLPPASAFPHRGFALQVRINTETLSSDGTTRPSSGTVVAFGLPSGPGVRTDTCGYVGYRPSPHFDSLLAKLICHSTSSQFAGVVTRAQRALREIIVEGVATNIPFLQRLLEHPDFVANRIDTGFVDAHISELTVDSGSDQRSGRTHIATVGARLNSSDPLAVLQYGKGEGLFPITESRATTVPLAAAVDRPEHAIPIEAPMQGTIVSIEADEGDELRQGQAVLIINAMKMEHAITAPTHGVLLRLTVQKGDTVPEGHLLALIDPGDVEGTAAEMEAIAGLDHVRTDLAEVHQRHALTLDAARPEAVARRRKTGQRTARENVADLCDPDSFVEYGALAIAAQRQRRSVEDLIERTPADGLVAGVGCVNGHLFDTQRAQCAVLAYDYTVLAGTQGFQNHRKKDRLFELVERLRIPLVFFTEGGGGRPGDTDAPFVASLDCMAFHLFSRLSALVPLVGITSGRCFAGNAALLGCCDVVIATRHSNIGMGGPAMIEGGGLGVFRPEEVGDLAVQTANGVVDVAVEDEGEAVRVAKQYLSYFQGPTRAWECADQRRLRGLVPENRLRVYEVRSVIETLADTGSVLELRRHFGHGMVTALARIEGRPIGVVANNPKHLSGAIDSPAADKAARFMQLCDAFDLPILFLCDTPGIMVGPEAEKTALVRHCCRMFVVGANLSVPFCTIVLRKSYGLGAQAMGGGSHKASLFTVSWPTGEFGGMGLEGAVKLGFRKELAAIEDAAERQRLFEHMVKRAYEHGKALNTASHFEIDDVIDPADSRYWITRVLGATPPPAPRAGKKRPCVDTW